MDAPSDFRKVGILRTCDGENPQIFRAFRVGKAIAWHANRGSLQAIKLPDLRRNFRRPSLSLSVAHDNQPACNIDDPSHYRKTTYGTALERASIASQGTFHPPNSPRSKPQIPGAAVYPIRTFQTPESRRQQPNL